MRLPSITMTEFSIGARPVPSISVPPWITRLVCARALCAQRHAAAPKRAVANKRRIILSSVARLGTRLDDNSAVNLKFQSYRGTRSKWQLCKSGKPLPEDQIAFFFAFAVGLATAQTFSMKSFAIGLSVRFFKATIAIVRRCPGR